jgi:hypothetical protein
MKEFLSVSYKNIEISDSDEEQEDGHKTEDWLDSAKDYMPIMKRRKINEDQSSIEKRLEREARMDFLVSQ